MSDTPETDKLAMTFGQVEMNLPESNFKLVPAYFARKLERERNLLREEMERLKGHAKRYRMRAEELEKDLAEARRIAEDFHAMGVDGQGLPPLPWK